MLNIVAFFQSKSEINKTKFLFFISLTVCLWAKGSLKACSQIIPDNTLPNNSFVTPDGDIINITEGTTVGNNLFHSFEQFSLTTGQTAFFQNATTIENILSRVTGSSISHIDGLIRSLGNANLFLINPNGIIFGSNAALDIGGSFIGSTANSIKFADGSEFSAISSPASSLLTISIPIGLQSGSNSGNIVVQGSGNNLSLNPDFSLDRSNRPEGLKVPNGKTFALIGKDINISGGNITATSGNIELWAVNNGLVPIVTRNGQIQIETGQEPINYSNIELSQAASIDASGNGGGDIQVQGQNVTVKDGSVILTSTLGTGSGGNLNVKATESIKVEGVSALSPIFSSILADVAPGAMGDGGNIIIDTDSLQVTEGGQISSGTFGLGNAGTLTVKTQKIQVSGGSPFGPSGLFTPVALGATGKGGDLTIETDSLEITDAGEISSGTFGFGTGGDLTIKADDIYISGGNEFAPSTLNAVVFKIPGIPEDIATFLGAGAGNGGNLIIETNSLRVTDGGQLAVSTSGTGAAGNLAIKAKKVELLGFNELGRSGLFANAIIESGNGGDISLTSERLIVRDGATISVGNFSSNNPNIPPGQGKAGSILIDADSVELDNTTSDFVSSITASTNSGGGGNISFNVTEGIILNNSSEIAAETKGSGNGGRIDITAKTLELNTGGLLSTSTEASGDAGRVKIDTDTVIFKGLDSGIFSEVKDAATGDGGSIAISAKTFNLNDRAQVSTNSTGLGQAGNIAITADEINTNQGKITATSTQTGGGNINLDPNFLFLDNNSLISTSVLDSSGGGGNIFINSTYVIGQKNSDLRANAVFGSGGNIDITTEVIFLSPDSDIDASSQFGLDGVVEIRNPESNQKIGVIELPNKITNPTDMITANCALEQDNELIVAGKGGLSENPSQYLRSQSVWEDLRDFEQQTSSVSSNEIIEAKGWVVNEKGNIELISQLPFNQCRTIE